jgi:uncharacterized protein (TIGR03435 family)
VLLLLAVCIAIEPAARPQSNASAPAQATQKPLSYEVVSITPNKSANENSGWRSTSDGIVLTNTPLSWLVRNAFGIIMDDQLSGLPGWVDSDRYDIQAKMDDETAAALKDLPRDERMRQERLMLQPLLADRCQLKFHRETKQFPVYELMIAKGGVKMKESVTSQGSGMSSGPGMFTAQSNTIESLIYSLSGQVGRIIVDKTGLGDKKFDFTLKWTPDEQQGTADAGPSLFTALEEQLGLKLVSSKGPVETVVIDRMEKPEPN